MQSITSTAVVDDSHVFLSFSKLVIKDSEDGHRLLLSGVLGD